MPGTDVKATRMDLLKLKKKITLASKGHKILKEKRDALVSEFFGLIDELKEKRKIVEENLADAYKAIILAEGVSGYAEVERAADSTVPMGEIGHKTKNIMGIKVPNFIFTEAEKKTAGRGYSLLSTSVEVDRAAKIFEDSLKLLIKLAEKEAAATKLAEEIKKTKRKVNALERILIPKLQSDVTYITMRLEEMERENFSRLKVIKKRIEGK